MIVTTLFFSFFLRCLSFVTLPVSIRSPTIFYRVGVYCALGYRRGLPDHSLEERRSGQLHPPQALVVSLFQNRPGAEKI